MKRVFFILSRVSLNLFTWMQYKTLNLLSALVLKQWWTKRGLIYTLRYMTAVTITIFCQPLALHDGCNNNNLLHLSTQKCFSLHILLFIIWASKPRTYWCLWTHEQNSANVLKKSLWNINFEVVILKQDFLDKKLYLKTKLTFQVTLWDPNDIPTSTQLNL